MTEVQIAENLKEPPRYQLCESCLNRGEWTYNDRLGLYECSRCGSLSPWCAELKRIKSGKTTL